MVLDELRALPRIMIVHGTSDDREVLKEMLEAHGISDPIILAQDFRPGDTISEKFELQASQADAAIALFTPDDQATLIGHSREISEFEWLARARQNVCLEYGWFWGRLGRNKVLLLLKGKLELPSDLFGVVYEHYTESPSECGAAIARFVSDVGKTDVANLAEPAIPR